jgi:hypothetical protein
MGRSLDEPSREFDHTTSPLAVRVDERARRPLSLSREGGRAVATLRPTRLKSRTLLDWLERHHVPFLIGGAVSDEGPPPPFLHLPTLVVCADDRLRDLAALYAHAVDAPMVTASVPDDIGAAIDASARASVTLVVQNDKLEEPLCQAAAAAARRHPGLSYGFLSAFTPEHLAWLIVKSWAMFLRRLPETVGFAYWSFSSPAATTRTRSVTSGVTTQERMEAPWRSDAVTMLNLRAHGAPFDVSMGDVVLCGRLDSLPGGGIQRAPSCFYDGECFRMKQTPGAPRERLEAVDARPLVWTFDSCASIPFRGTAFGESTSYAFGLIAGAAVGVVGPFLDLTTKGDMSRKCEAVLATGGTLGEVVAAACALEPGRGFDKFLLIGSPDLRLLPVQRLKGQRSGQQVVYHVRGEAQHAFRLALPADVVPPVHVVADDGGAQWAGARCHLFEHGATRDLVVVLEDPVDVDGWLAIGWGAATDDQLVEEASQVLDNLNAIRLYPFVDTTVDVRSVARCRRLARLLRDVASQSGRLRCRMDAAPLLASLMIALDDLHRQVAVGFLAAVSAHDVNLDRFASDRFDLRPTLRSDDRCPACGVALYVTQTHWCRRPSYVRRWVQCPNCSGLSITLEHSPLEVLPPVATRAEDRLLVSIHMRNRGTAPVAAMVAGLARQGGLADAGGPLPLFLAVGESKNLVLALPLAGHAPGVLSYRLVLLCRAGVELFALKHVITPADTAASAACSGRSTLSLERSMPAI